LLAALMLVGMVTGCVSTPEKSADENSGSAIQFTENASVDLAVRRDFDSAVKLLREERYEEGIELLEKVLKVSQNNSAPYINIAIAYRKTGEIERAEDNLKKALEINPRHPATLNEYALLYRESGRYAEAKGQYLQLLENYPEFWPARKNFGVLCELYLNDKPCAISQYEVYLDAKPQDKDVKLWLTGLQR
jgi:tetratricopeptide (TPR) repeat protein